MFSNNAKMLMFLQNIVGKVKKSFSKIISLANSTANEKKLQTNQ